MTVCKSSMSCEREDSGHLLLCHAELLPMDTVGVPQALLNKPDTMAAALKSEAIFA